MNDVIRNEDLRSLQGMIDLFRSNIKEYKSNAYDEANTRVDFII